MENLISTDLEKCKQQKQWVEADNTNLKEKLKNKTVECGNMYYQNRQLTTLIQKQIEWLKKNDFEMPAKSLQIQLDEIIK